MKRRLSSLTQTLPIQHVACDKEMAGLEWKNKETYTLITVWGEDRVQITINGCKQNKPDYIKIAVENGLLEKDRDQCLEP